MNHRTVPPVRAGSADPSIFLSAAGAPAPASFRETTAANKALPDTAKRYSAAIIDNAAGDFFGTFLYPAVFPSGPALLPVWRGPAKAPLGHALVHRFVAQSDFR